MKSYKQDQSGLILDNTKNGANGIHNKAPINNKIDSVILLKAVHKFIYID